MLSFGDIFCFSLTGRWGRHNKVSGLRVVGCEGQGDGPDLYGVVPWIQLLEFVATYLLVLQMRYTKGIRFHLIWTLK